MRGSKVFKIGILSLSLTVLSHADTALLLNTRESRSVVISSGLIRGAKSWLGPNLTAVTQLENTFREWSDLLQPESKLCEVDVVTRLSELLVRDGLAKADERNAYQALILFREKGWIDDLVLMPLLATERGMADFSNHDGDISSVDEKKDAVADDGPKDKVTDADLRKKIFSNLPACPNDAFSGSVSQVREHLGRGYRPAKMIRWIRKAYREDLISARVRGELIALLEAKFDRTPKRLSAVLTEMAIAKKPNRPGEEGASSLASEKIKGRRYLSKRLGLYARYSGVQIVLLSETFRKFKDRISEKASAEILIHYGKPDRPDETYALSPLEQYRMAVKMLHKEIEEMKLSKLFDNKRVGFEDLILAGLETGEIAARDLEQVLKVDDLWNPEVTGFQKMYNWAKVIGMPMLVLIPPPYNVMASLIIVISETVLMNKKTKDADDLGSSIF